MVPTPCLNWGNFRWQYDSYFFFVSFAVIYRNLDCLCIEDRRLISWRWQWDIWFWPFSSIGNHAWTEGSILLTQGFQGCGCSMGSKVGNRDGCYCRCILKQIIPIMILYSMIFELWSFSLLVCSWALVLVNSYTLRCVVGVDTKLA